MPETGKQLPLIEAAAAACSAWLARQLTDAGSALSLPPPVALGPVVDGRRR